MKFYITGTFRLHCSFRLAGDIWSLALPQLSSRLFKRKVILLLYLSKPVQASEKEGGSKPQSDVLIYCIFYLKYWGKMLQSVDGVP